MTRASLQPRSHAATCRIRLAGTALHGFTLLELVLSLVIMSLVMLAAQSAIVVATRAVPNDASVSAATFTGAAALDRIVSELAYATSITTYAPTQIIFTVADRNNDGLAETIQYSWDGTAGSPLLRHYNADPPEIVADDVREFSLTYDTRAVQLPAGFTESGEILLASSNGSLVTFDYRVDADDWVGQYFKPAIPGNASSWRITRVVFRAKTRGSNDGEVGVQLRPATGSNVPSRAIYEQVRMLESALSSSYQWHEIQFQHMADLSPDMNMCLVLQGIGSGDACEVQYRIIGSGTTQGNLVWTSNSGSTWNGLFTQQLQYFVYGTYTTPDPIGYRYYMVGVQCALRVGGNATSRVTAAVRMLNEPQVSGP